MKYKINWESETTRKWLKEKSWISRRALIIAYFSIENKEEKQKKIQNGKLEAKNKNEKTSWVLENRTLNIYDAIVWKFE